MNPFPERREHHVYVVLHDQGPDSHFVELEDHRGHGRGGTPTHREGQYRLLEFPSSEHYDECRASLDDAVKEIAELREVVAGLGHLMANSEAVAGWHENGATAPWDTLFSDRERALIAKVAQAALPIPRDRS